MNGLLKKAIDSSFAVNLVTGFVILAGCLTLWTMTRDLHPPFQFDRVNVVVNLPGASPLEIEKYVTFPIEESLKGLAGIEKITSRSHSGYSRIKIHYIPGYEHMEQAPEKVRSRLNKVRYRLPTGIQSVSVNRQETNSIFLSWFGLSGFDKNKPEHRYWIEFFKRKLSAIPGIIEVKDFSAPRNIHIEFYPEKLKQNNISMLEARKAVAEATSFIPIGYKTMGDQFLTIEMEKNATTVESLQKIPITSNRMGKGLLLEDIALVRFKLGKQEDISRVNGRNAYHMVARKDTTTDIIVLKDKMNHLVAGINRRLPSSMEIVVLEDGPFFIERQLSVLKKNGIMGFFLVLLIMVLFLNWRVAFMTILGVPVAYFGTLLILNYFGININLISVIGLILVLGILVDDAIIISEKYAQNLEAGLAPKEAALNAAKSLMTPVTGTILTTAVAFAPLLIVKSKMATLLFSVPVIVISSLIISWLESFFILPNHLAHFVKQPLVQKNQGFMHRAKNIYKWLLGYSLRFRYPLMICVIGLMGASGYVATKKIRHDFELRVQSERLTVYAVLKESPSLEHTLKILKPLEKRVMAMPEEMVSSVMLQMGRIWMNGQRQTGYRFAKMDVFLNKSHAHPTDLKWELKDLLESEMELLKSEEFEKLYVRVSRGDDNEKKEDMVSVRVKGPEDVSFAEMELAIKTAGEKVAGIIELVAEPDKYEQNWTFVPDREALKQYRLSPPEVALQLRGIFKPDKLSEVRQSGATFFIYTEMFQEHDVKYDELMDVEVLTVTGTSVPLKFLGHWKKLKTLGKIRHRDGQRNLVLDFRYDSSETNVNLIKSRLMRALVPVARQYSDYQLEVVQADEEAEKNQAWAIKIALFCILSVLFVMALSLGSLTQPLLVGMPIPAGLIGIIWALYFHNFPLGIMALIGLVGTVGVSVNASIVMMDEINLRMKKKGRWCRETLIAGASSRFRAILMTTLTTLGGVFPMAYGLGGESGFTQPLAFSIGWGLLFSTTLTLVGLPALIQIREDFLNGVRWTLTRMGLRKTVTPGDFESERAGAILAKEFEPIMPNQEYLSESLAKKGGPKSNQQVDPKHNEKSPETGPA